MSFYFLFLLFLYILCVCEIKNTSYVVIDLFDLFGCFLFICCLVFVCLTKWRSRAATYSLHEDSSYCTSPPLPPSLCILPCCAGVGTLVCINLQNKFQCGEVGAVSSSLRHWSHILCKIWNTKHSLFWYKSCNIFYLFICFTVVMRMSSLAHLLQDNRLSSYSHSCKKRVTFFCKYVVNSLLCVW